MVAVLVSAEPSGAHVNPAVTLAFATLGECKLTDIPVYWAAQYLGAFLGAAIPYGVYYQIIDKSTGFGEGKMMHNQQ